MRNWWLKQGMGLEDLLRFLESRSGKTMREYALRGSTLREKAERTGWVYHSAKALIEACCTQAGTVEAVPRRPRLTEEVPISTFNKLGLE